MYKAYGKTNKWGKDIKITYNDVVIFEEIYLDVEDEVDTPDFIDKIFDREIAKHQRNLKLDLLLS
ncbi:hypothetical protein [Flavobacterium sp. N3904]|uniref:hypothetical protein n=1 Tax=Flavobacterium sp. N3904 TaxID=2986835 RepID=UPI002223F690|nr:hypothetical protein [Flavobacterium sp. N3904]